MNPQNSILSTDIVFINYNNIILWQPPAKPIDLNTSDCEPKNNVQHRTKQKNILPVIVCQAVRSETPCPKSHGKRCKNFQLWQIFQITTYNLPHECSHFSGITSDMGTFMGQIVRGNLENYHEQSAP